MSLPKETDWNKFNTPEWYDYYYFADKVGKSFRRADGSIEYWGYRNPDGAWSGCKPIVEAWKTIFQPKNMLDVGAGRGQFITAARKVGIKADGFDFSVFAVNEGRDPQCKPEWLRVHDATKRWPYADKSFELVVALDFWEHIYQEDLQFVMEEMFRVAGKWVFLQIAVAGSGGLQGRSDKGYAFAKDQKVPIELEGCAVAGHVTIVNAETWEQWLDHDDWLIRRDLVNYFISLVDPSIIRNWLLNMMLVYERIE